MWSEILQQDVDLERLKTDRKYWDDVSQRDEMATHFCTESGGFEYLTKGSECDIAKPEADDD